MRFGVVRHSRLYVPVMGNECHADWHLVDPGTPYTKAVKKYKISSNANSSLTVVVPVCLAECLRRGNMHITLHLCKYHSNYKWRTANMYKCTYSHRNSKRNSFFINQS